MYGCTLTPIDFSSIQEESIPASLKQLLFAAPTGQSVYYDGSGPIPDYYLKDFSLGQGDERLSRGQWCYNFDGTDDYVSLPSPVGLTLQGDFTVSLFAKTDALLATQWLVHASGSAGAIANMSYSGADGVLIFGTTTGWKQFAVNSTEWNHWTFIHDTSLIGLARFRLFKNGVEQSGIDVGTYLQPVGNATCNIGRRTSGVSYYDGKMYDIRFYDKSLSADEVTHVYTLGQSGTDPTETNLVAHYPCQEEAGGITYDRSPNKYHGTHYNTSAGFHATDPGVLKSWPNDDGYTPAFTADDTLIKANVSGTNNTLSFKIRTVQGGVIPLTNSSDTGWMLVPDSGSTSTGIYLGVGTPSLVIDGIVFNGNRSQLYALLVDGQIHDVTLSSINFTNIAWLNGLYFGGYGHSSRNVITGTTQIWDVVLNGERIDGPVKIPAASPTEDALGGTLTYTGRCPYPGLAKSYAWVGDGTTATVRLGQNTVPNGNHSIKFWLYCPAGTASQRIMDARSPNYYMLFINTGAEGRITLYSKNSTGVAINNMFTPNSWNLFELVESSGTITCTVTKPDGTIATTSQAVSVSTGWQNAYLNFLGGNSSSGFDSGSTGKLGPIEITAAGLTTTYYPRNGSTTVDVIKSDGTSSEITSAVQGSMTYSLGNGHWRNPAIENGGWSNGTLLVPAAEGGSVAANGEDVNILPNQAPIGVIVDRTGGIAAPLHGVMGTDAYDAEEFDDATSESNIDKRLIETYSSDRYGAALVDISGEDYFDA